jgi:hypothetical protein
MKFDKLLKNKYLYYAAVALMVINVLGYVAMGSIECILALGGAAYLAQHFTKNRTLDILVGLFVSNILFGCGRLKEGYQEANETAAETAQKAACKAAMEAPACKKSGGTFADGSCTCPVTEGVANKKKELSNVLADTANKLNNGDKEVAAAQKKKKQGFFN